MAAVLKCWREAATLIIVTAKSRGVTFKPVGSTRVSGDTAFKSKGEFDTLLLKRNSKSKFMPNMYVFPGGVASDADFSQEWLDIFNLVGKETVSELFHFVQRGGPGAPMFSRTRDPQFGSIPSEIAFRICAIRETFEESGVLLARYANSLTHMDPTFVAKGPVWGSVCSDMDVIKNWRDRVDKDAHEFITMCKELELVPDVWSLYEWSNWLTPVHGMAPKSGRSRRFDTAFFICCLNEKPDAIEDQGETVHSQWGSPPDVLHQFQSGHAQIASPQLYEISCFMNFSNLEELHQFAFERSQQRVERWMPVRCSSKDAILFVYPGDDLYPEILDLEGAEEEIIYSESLDSLEKKFPNTNRSVTKSSETGSVEMYLSCTVQNTSGHLLPVTQFPVTAPDSSMLRNSSKL